MAKMMPRGKAADKLLKGMPEEDPTMESPSAPQAAPQDAPAMPALADQSQMPSDDAGMPPPDVGMPPEAPGDAGQAPDIDSALSGVEAAIQGYSEDASREIRTHLEAIKDIAAKEDGGQMGQAEAETPDSAAQMPSDMPSSADLGDAMGMDERR